MTRKIGLGKNEVAKTRTIRIVNRRWKELGYALIKTYTNAMVNGQKKAKRRALWQCLKMLIFVSCLLFGQSAEAKNQIKTSLGKQYALAQQIYPLDASKLRKRTLWMMLESVDERTLYA